MAVQIQRCVNYKSSDYINLSVILFFLLSREVSLA